MRRHFKDAPASFPSLKLLQFKTFAVALGWEWAIDFARELSSWAIKPFGNRLCGTLQPCRVCLQLVFCKVETLTVCNGAHTRRTCVCMYVCLHACMYVHTYCVLTMKILHARLVRIHMYVCIYVCMYLSIERESVCARNKSIVCGNRFVFTPFVCIMYELCVIECVCIPLFFFLKRHKHTQRTHFRHLQSPSICRRCS